jgi:hypothetical protein
MDIKEYDNRKKQIIEQHRKELHYLDVEYAISGIKARIGDIISDKIKIIKVDKFHVSTTFTRYPEVIWRGFEYTKSRKQRKDLARGSIREASIVEDK